MVRASDVYRQSGGKVLNFGKPAGYTYRHIEGLIENFDPSRTLAIGDQFGSDCEGARRAGIDSVLVATGAAFTTFPGCNTPADLVAELHNETKSGKLTPPAWVMPSLRW